MSKLWASGCSFTYGHGLPDCHIEPDNPGPEPSKFAWPQLLANKLDYECVNLAQCGRGVRYVWHQLITRLELFKKEDLVIVMWPEFSSRVDIIKGLPYDNGPDRLCDTIYTSNEDFFKKYHNDYDRWIEFELVSDHLAYSLNNKNINCIQAIYNYPGFRDQFRTRYNLTKKSDSPADPFYLAGLPVFNNADIIKTNFSQIAGSLPRALDKNHPGTEAHIEFANVLYKEIKKRSALKNAPDFLKKMEQRKHSLTRHTP